jgi:hypothetical protein
MNNFVGDLLDAFDDRKVDVIFQICNSYNCWGSGIVVPIKKRYPQAYEADKEAYEQQEVSLGKYSVGYVSNQKIFNIYAMWGIGNDGNPVNRNLSYDAFYNAMYNICENELRGSSPILGTIVIGVPKYIGCARAGGSWTIVEAMMEDIENIFDVEFHVYELEEPEFHPRSSVTIPKEDFEDLCNDGDGFDFGGPHGEGW